MKNKLFTAAITLVILGGVGLIAYPTVANLWNNVHSSKTIAAYDASVQDISEEEKDAMLLAAREYNLRLQHDETRFSPSSEMTELYKNTLDVTGTGMMGYVNIPKLNVNLPIYHGTDEMTLSVAVGHLEGSSLPIGGVGNHVAVSGHTALPSAKLFTGLDKLETGDVFFVQVLGNVLAYRVDAINTVLPDEFDLLALDSDEDYCTLITCTPYGVNSHRLLVRGERVEYTEEVRDEVEQVTQNNFLHTVLILGVVGVGVIAVVLVLTRKPNMKAEKVGEDDAEDT